MRALHGAGEDRTEAAVQVLLGQPVIGAGLEPGVGYPGDQVVAVEEFGVVEADKELAIC